MGRQSVDHLSKLFHGAFVLTLGAVITKVLSAIYRVPFQNIVGDIGFYIYQQVYPFYGIAIALSTYGFPVLLSKIKRESELPSHSVESQKIIIAFFYVLLCLSGIWFIILYFGANFIARKMGDTELVPLLKIISFVYLFIPFISFFRGYFQGSSNMIPSAVSQVGEQLVRVITILLLSYLFVSNGYNLYVVGAGAIFGSLTGGLTAFIVLLTFFKRQNAFSSFKLVPLSMSDWKLATRVVLIQGVAICISHLLLVFMQLVDALNLYSLLVDSGLEPNEAKEAKGIYDRGQPLIQLGTVAATSLSLSIVPLISESKLKKQWEFLLHKIKLSIKISIVIGVGASFGLMSIIRPTNRMLFENTNGSNILLVLSFTILFSSLILTLSAILQGLGQMIYPAIIIIVGAVLKYLLNLLLIPLYGSLGAALASLIIYALILISLFIRLRCLMKVSLIPFRVMAIPLIGSIGMYSIIKGYFILTNKLYIFFEQERLVAAFQSLTAVIIGGVVYITILIIGKIFTESELAFMPFGSKASFIRKKFVERS